MKCHAPEEEVLAHAANPDPPTRRARRRRHRLLLDAHENVDGLRFVGADVSGQDLSGLTVTECAFEDLDAHDVLPRGAVETAVEQLNAPIIAAPRSRFREVSIDQSRIGSAEFYESNWRSVHITGSKLGFVNLRGAVLQDVQFTNCSIDELDLGGATVNRLAFVDCTLNSLDVTRATLQNVDLRELDLRRISGLEGLKGATMVVDAGLRTRLDVRRAPRHRRRRLTVVSAIGLPGVYAVRPRAVTMVVIGWSLASRSRRRGRLWRGPSSRSGAGGGEPRRSSSPAAR